jgi:dTDP-4-amino-4,6-dideoxygalactose transaminase
MVDLGYNHRLTDIQCALGSSQLKKLDSFIQRRNEIADAYATAFKECPGGSTIRDIDGVANAHYLAAIRLNFRRQIHV